MISCLIKLSFRGRSFVARLCTLTNDAGDHGERRGPIYRALGVGESMPHAPMHLFISMIAPIICFFLGVHMHPAYYLIWKFPVAWL
jgi:hypothetical protein